MRLLPKFSPEFLPILISKRYPSLQNYLEFCHFTSIWSASLQRFLFFPLNCHVQLPGATIWPNQSVWQTIPKLQTNLFEENLLLQSEIYQILSNQSVWRTFTRLQINLFEANPSPLCLKVLKMKLKQLPKFLPEFFQNISFIAKFYLTIS